MQSAMRVFLVLAALFACNGLLLAQESSFFSDNPTIRVASVPGPIVWNPNYSYSAQEAQIFTAVYEGLVTNHPVTQKPLPAVAERWEISADHLKYTFYFRANARWWNGEKVTAKQFRDSWLNMLAIGEAAPFGSLLDAVHGASDFRQGKLKDPSKVGIVASSDTTLEVTLDHPTPYFLQILAHQSMVPIYPSQLKTKDWSKLPRIIGNGPYALQTKTNESLTFVKNEFYWDKANVAISKIDFILSDNSSEITARFNNHEIQWISSGAAFDKLNDKSTVFVTPQFSTSFYFFNQRLDAFTDPRVRKALTMLLPLEKMRSKEQFYIPSSKLVPSIPYYPDVASLEKQDKDAAYKLLTEAGFPNGKGLPTLTVKLDKSEVSDKIFASFKEAWGSLETPVELVQISPEKYTDSLQSKDYALGTISWIGDYPDPLTFLDLFSSNGNLNVSGNSATEYQDLLTKANTQSGSERYKTLGKAEEYLLLNAVCIPTNHSPALNVIDQVQVDGWYENPFDLHPFKYLKPKEPRPPRNVALGFLGL